jgi:hypothetical protein
MLRRGESRYPISVVAKIRQSSRQALKPGERWARMPTKRCQNVADSCWREFSSETYHVRIGERCFCSHTCATAWIEQNSVFSTAANPFSEKPQSRRQAS